IFYRLDYIHQLKLEILTKMDQIMEIYNNIHEDMEEDLTVYIIFLTALIIICLLSIPLYAQLNELSKEFYVIKQMFHYVPVDVLETTTSIRDYLFSENSEKNQEKITVDSGAQV